MLIALEVGALLYLYGAAVLCAVLATFFIKEMRSK
jgi:hypothetical protein